MTPYAIKILGFGNFTMQIQFDNNEIREFSAKTIWHHPFWHSLKNKTIFETAKIDGISISWINEIDIAPEDLYELSKPLEANLVE